MRWQKFVMGFCLVCLTGCSSASWENRAKSVVGTAVSGKKVSFGNPAECASIRNQCRGQYQEWLQNGETACSCD